MRHDTRRRRPKVPAILHWIWQILPATHSRARVDRRTPGDPSTEQRGLVRELLGGRGAVFTRDGRISARFAPAGSLDLAGISYESDSYNAGSGSERIGRKNHLGDFLCGEFWKNATRLLALLIYDILHSTLGRWLVEASVRGDPVPSEVKFHKDTDHQPAVGIQSASNHEFGRHALDRISPSFHRRNFSHTGERQQPALFSLSIFNFSADGTQK
jgi:hypothetical protein